MSTTEIEALSQKARLWESTLKTRLVERDREAKGFVIAAMAKAHHLQLGEPGIAKSFLVTSGLRLVDGANTMEILLHGYSVMEDMYGPLSFKAMADDRYLRKTEGYVPDCDFLFGDEVFKGNPTMLNTNLWAFNERKFRNDGKVNPIPLITGYFASNEGPDDPALAAFDDRIQLRYLVSHIREPQNRIAMFRARLARAVEPAPEPVISIAEIRQINELINTIVIPDNVLEALNTLYDELCQAQIRPTDRKMGDTLSIIQATALFNGRATATIADMTMLRDMLWLNPKDRAIVAEKVYDLSSPIDKEAQVIANSIQSLAAEVEEIIGIESKTIRVRRGTQLHTKLQDANTELLDMARRAESLGQESEVVKEARKHLHTLTRRLLIKGFKIPHVDGKLDQEQLRALIKEIKAEQGDAPDNG